MIKKTLLLTFAASSMFSQITTAKSLFSKSEQKAIVDQIHQLKDEHKKCAQKLTSQYIEKMLGKKKFARKIKFTVNQIQYTDVFKAHVANEVSVERLRIAIDPIINNAVSAIRCTSHNHDAPEKTVLFEVAVNYLLNDIINRSSIDPVV